MQEEQKSDPSKLDSLPVTHGEHLGDVPVFQCVVYLANVDNQVHARVANLNDLTCVAANEREALRSIVGAFKKRLVEHTSNDEPIPWIEPPEKIADGEVQRLIPVHL